MLSKPQITKSKHTKKKHHKLLALLMNLTSHSLISPLAGKPLQSTITTFKKKHHQMSEIAGFSTSGYSKAFGLFPHI